MLVHNWEEHCHPAGAAALLPLARNPTMKLIKKRSIKEFFDFI